MAPSNSGVPFIVEEVLRLNELAFIFVRALEPTRTWTLSDQSTLGGFRLQVKTPTPDPHDLRGTGRTNVFLFQLRSAQDRHWFRTGDTVLLEG